MNQGFAKFAMGLLSILGWLTVLLAIVLFGGLLYAGHGPWVAIGATLGTLWSAFVLLVLSEVLERLVSIESKVYGDRGVS